MGLDSNSTVVFVGVARLPQPLVACAPSVAVELDVELRRRRVVAVATNLQLPRLKHMLDSVLVGRTLGVLAEDALVELEVRYSAAFASAVVAAVRAALRSAAAVSREGERTQIASTTSPLGMESPPPEPVGARSVPERSLKARGERRSA